MNWCGSTASPGFDVSAANGDRDRQCDREQPARVPHNGLLPCSGLENARYRGAGGAEPTAAESDAGAVAEELRRSVVRQLVKRDGHSASRRCCGKQEQEHGGRDQHTYVRRIDLKLCAIFITAPASGTASRRHTGLLA